MLDRIQHAKTAIRCAILFAATCLTACGGGSDGASNSTGSNGSPPSSSTTTSLQLTLSGTPPASVQVGSAYSFQPTVSQSSGTVQFSISGNPAWLVLNPATGALSGTPTSANAGTTGAITITAGDSGSTASIGPFTIDVLVGGAMAPTVSIKATPSTVASGATSALTWSASNATSCTASGGWSGTEPTSGSKSTAALSATTKYSLTCSGAGGSASQSAVVSVASSGSSASTIPNITALPANSPGPDVAGYTALNIGSRPSGYSWNDTVTGVKTWKITASGTPGSSSYFPWYSSAGLEISLPWGPNLDQYHIAFIDEHGNGYVCDFGLSTSATPGPYNFRALPSASYAQTVSAFSRSNANIMYIFTSNGYLRLYDVATSAYVDSQAASLGYSSSWPATGWPWSTGITGWVTCNATETWCMANNAGSGSTMYALNLTDGKTITWSTAVDDTYGAYGDFVTGDQQSQIWGLDTNTQFNISPALTSANGWQDSEPTSHGGSLRGYWVFFNTDGSASQPMQAAVIDQSTGVATIGAYPGGVPNAPKYWGEYHVSGEWWLQEPGPDQYLLMSNWDTPSAAPGPASEEYALTFLNVWAGTAYRLGFSYSNYTAIGSTSNYWSQPHATQSHDGKLVIFASDMLGNSRIDLFAVEVPVTAGTPPAFP